MSEPLNRLLTPVRLTILLIILTTLGVLAATAAYSPVGWDSYWHLKMGLDWVVNGLSPFVDHYSFTHEGETVRGAPIFFQATYFGFYYLFGESGGAIAIKLFSFILILFLLTWWMKRVHAPLTAYLIVLPSLAVILQFRAMVRPEFFSYCFALLALILYQRTQLRLNWKTMTPILALMVIWVNFHSSIIGYVIFFGLFVDVAFRLLSTRATSREWIIWGSWGAAIFAVGFLNRYWTHPLQGAFSFSPEWKDLIVEYVFPMKYLYTIPIYFIIGIALVALFLAVRQKKIGYIIIMMVTANAAMTMSRMVTLSCLLILAMFAHTLADAPGKPLIKPSSKLKKPVLVGISSLISIAMLTFSIQSIGMFKNMKGNMGNVLPADMIEYLLDQPDSGTILNQYRLGGYLAFHLHPKYEIYIDGRTNILYPLSHMQKYDQAISNLTTMFEVVDEYEIDYAIFLNESRYPLFMFFSGYGLDFADESFSLYSRENSNFPLLGRTVAVPYCWNDADTENLRLELSLAESLLPKNSYLSSLITRLFEYIQASSTTKMIEDIKVADLKSDVEKRFIIYRALETGQFEKALEIMPTLGEWLHKDTLAAAYAYLETKDYSRAKKAIVRSTGTPRNEIVTNDLVVQLKILNKLGHMIELQEPESRYLESMENSQDFDYENLVINQAVDSRMFCEERLRSFYINN